MTNADVEHRSKAIQAIETAESGGPEESQAAQVYAIVAVAQAVLASQSVLVDIRNELQKFNALRSQ